MSEEKTIYEKEADTELLDPDETPIKDRKVITQPYDLIIESLMEQIGDNTIFLRPMSERPNFQRKYVWSDKLASRLVESILLNVPIPPCYLSQNEEFELDVIDGQQRLFSIYRFIENRFKLSSLEVLSDLNGNKFFELPSRTQRQLKTHTLRCILISNQSHPEIKFDVFERLNTNTMPLNAQELRNCVYRGSLNTMLLEASEHVPWLEILGRKRPDNRLRDEELILRFFAFELLGLKSYRTPQKQWLNEAAKLGKHFSEHKVNGLLELWKHTIQICLIWFDPKECFRRKGSKSINRALFDLVASTAKTLTVDEAKAIRRQFRKKYFDLENHDEFQDLISRAVDHKSRTRDRFRIWAERMAEII